jgi:chromosome partitioning protein
VLLDCPPNIQLCTWSALAAADGVIVPTQLEDFGAQGVTTVLNTVDRARAAVNPRLGLIGLLPTMAQRCLRVHATYEAGLRKVYGDDVFTAVVPAAKDFKEAVTLRKPVCEHRPLSPAARAIEAVADELLARADARCRGAAPGLVSGSPEGAPLRPKGVV